MKNMLRVPEDTHETTEGMFMFFKSFSHRSFFVYSISSPQHILIQGLINDLFADDSYLNSSPDLFAEL